MRGTLERRLEKVEVENALAEQKRLAGTAPSNLRKQLTREEWLAKYNPGALA